MKKILLFPVLILALALLTFPKWIGYVYLTVTAVLGVAAVAGATTPLWGNVLFWLLCAYPCLALVTFVVMTVFTFRHCCIGMSSFKGHLKHAGKRHVDNLKVAALWPQGWYTTVKWAENWGMDWTGVLIEPFSYLLSTLRHGHRVEMYVVKHGE
ncbi:MAG TPA: hypothetical protein VLA04_00700 [Verrucomicrobiae bacterium]|nr:hypothetical protein [Verrucomicrobiae bacterium]